MFRLKIVNKMTSESREVSLDGVENIIGRIKSAKVELQSDGVSRKHAVVVVEGDCAFITDLGSGNGTFLNGERLLQNKRHLLQDKDLISIENYDILFKAGEEEDVDEEVTQSEPLEIKLLKKVIGALDHEKVPSFEILNGSMEGKKFLLTDEKDEFVIGRDDDSSFQIKEHVISRKHATISKKWGGISIRDMDSRNGTFLNNRRVVEDILHDGDRIALGTIVLQFRNPQEIKLPETITPKNVPAKIDVSQIPLTSKSAADEIAAPAKVPEAQRQKQEEQYPTPTAVSRFTIMEIGLMGMGGFILIFAVITIANLILIK